MKKKKPKRIIEKHKYTVIGPVERKEELYPETNRPIIRPKINYKKMAFWLTFDLILVNALAVCAVTWLPWVKDWGMAWGWRFVLTLLALLFVNVIVCAKPIIIFLIRLYQRYAPYEVRSRCLFIPNCSEYMILAIKKYGVIRGLVKGIRRLKRCEEPNGGIDYP